MKGLLIFCIITITGIQGGPDGPDLNQLTEIFHWDILDFDVSPNQREQALASGSFIPNRNGIFAIGVWRGKMFVTVFRFNAGVLSSLNYFSLNTTDKSPVLRPYPSFEANYVNEDPDHQTVSLTSPSSLINAAHMQIDKCDRLWVMDSGFTDMFGTRRWIAPPAIVIFDLNTDTLVRRIEIPQQFINPNNMYIRIALDFDGTDCDHVHAYVADAFRSIIVYSFKKDRVWQVEDNSMASDPLEGDFIYENINFQWNYGIIALVVGDRQPDGSKPVYFAPLSSTSLYYVSNRVLQDETYSLKENNNEFHLLGNSGKGWQTMVLAYDDKTGTIFSSIFAGATIGCWNTQFPFQSWNKLHKTTPDFFPLGLTIDEDRNVWAVSNLLPFSVGEGFQRDRKNVRIFKDSVDQAIAGTNCTANNS